jgi:hypothetical protein
MLFQPARYSGSVFRRLSLGDRRACASRSTAAAGTVWCGGKDCRYRVGLDPTEQAARYGAWSARNAGSRNIDFVLSGASQ